jgi:hypothetical protein
MVHAVVVEAENLEDVVSMLEKTSSTKEHFEKQELLNKFEGSSFSGK